MVEAYRVGTQRTNEFREADQRAKDGLPPRHVFFDAAEDESEAFLAIRRAVESKAAKHYRPRPHLLVYVNYWDLDPSPGRAREVAQALAAWHGSFAALWLLWGGTALRCWPEPAEFTALESDILGSTAC